MLAVKHYYYVEITFIMNFIINILQGNRFITKFAISRVQGNYLLTTFLERFLILIKISHF